MDDADRAKIAEEREYERFWQSRHQPLAMDDDDKPYDCIVCDDRIPPARVNLGFKLRCVECQKDYEKEQQRKRMQ